MSQVIGIDPGLARTGVAVIKCEPSGTSLIYADCIETNNDLTDPQRLAIMHTKLGNIITQYRPDSAAVEKLFFAANQLTAMRVAQARGVILCALAQFELPISEYTPLQVKEAVAGWGGADKKQVTHMVQKLLKRDVLGHDDVTDACAIAICHHHRHNQQMMPEGNNSKISSGLAAAVASAQAEQAAKG